MMRAHAYFARVDEARQEVDTLRRRRDKYIEMATGMSGMSETAIRGNSTRSRVEAAALSLVELSDRLDIAAEGYAQTVREAEALIARLQRPRHRQVLTLRYIEGRKWREITQIMGYTDPKSAFRVHGWALQAAQKLLDDV